MKLRNQALRYGAVVTLLAPVAVFAADPYAAITTAIDFDGVTPVILAAAAALAVVFVLKKGVKLALSMIK